MLAVYLHVGLNSLYLSPLVLAVVLSAKKSPKLTFTTDQRRSCKSAIDPDVGDAVRYKVLAWLIYHNMTI